MTHYEKEYMRIVGCMFGVAAAMKDLKDLNLSPNYLAMENRLIELFNQYENLRKQNEPAKKTSR